MDMSKEQVIHWAYLIDGSWRLVVAATQRGLCYVGSQERDISELAEWAHRQFKNFRLVENEETLSPYLQQLKEYLRGQRVSFAVPLDLQGTPFQLAVWRLMNDIPYGQTVSYQELAERIRKPSAVRAVGSAIGKNPALIISPCHRIIGKSGRLTGYRGGLKMKEDLLLLERGGTGV
jgi:methylated-DNA-[protein]-cysteine S-methyltransferase